MVRLGQAPACKQLGPVLKSHRRLHRSRSSPGEKLPRNADVGKRAAGLQVRELSTVPWCSFKEMVLRARKI